MAIKKSNREWEKDTNTQTKQWQEKCVAIYSENLPAKRLIVIKMKFISVHVISWRKKMLHNSFIRFSLNKFSHITFIDIHKIAKTKQTIEKKSKSQSNNRRVFLCVCENMYIFLFVWFIDLYIFDDINDGQFKTHLKINNNKCIRSSKFAKRLCT